MKSIQSDFSENKFNKGLVHQGESLDIIFASSKTASKIQCSEITSMFQARLYHKRDYFLSKFKTVPHPFAQDDQMIVELTSLKVKTNYSDKGGQYVEASSTIGVPK